MLEINKFIDKYKSSKSVQNILSTIVKSSCGEIVYIASIADGLVPFLIYITSDVCDTWRHIYVAESREDAEAVFANFYSLSSVKAVFYSQINSEEFLEEKLKLAEVKRNEVLSTVVNAKEKIVLITYFDALNDVVPSVQDFQNSIIINQYDSISVSGLTHILSTNKFVNKEKVEKPGDFAIKNEIVDFFSFSSSLPFRIYFSDDVIVKITKFDCNNQCSVKEVTQADIFISKTNISSILDFLQEGTYLWTKNLASLIDKNENANELSTRHKKNILADYLKKCITIDVNAKIDKNASLVIHYNSINKRVLLEDIILTKEQQSEKSVKYIFCSEYGSVDKLRSLFSTKKLRDDFIVINIPLSSGFVDLEMGVCVYTDHELFDFSFNSKLNQTSFTTLNTLFNESKRLNFGDYIVHKNFGIGRFAGLVQKKIGESIQEFVRLIYRDNAAILVSLQSIHYISKYIHKEDSPPKIDKLGLPAWDQKKAKVKAKVKSIAKDLMLLYAKRRSAEGYAFCKDTDLQEIMEGDFAYKDTRDQQSVMRMIKNDMESNRPMDRLVCGDVGFGKTELAIRAAFKATQEKKQVAVLVPTTILALQHYNSFRKRITKFGPKVEHLSRFRSAKEIKQIEAEISSGDVDIVIGTHKILSESIKFKDLGLLIVDEEQKFGVSAKEKIKKIKSNVDTLTMTATPIPRTLHFSLMGARDISLITTPPLNRCAVKTFVREYSESLTREAIKNEIARDGQVIFINNRIADLESIAIKLQKLVHEAKVCIIHGGMSAKEIEENVIKFINQETNVLLSTSIVESGIDIPTANTLIVNKSNHFGLSDLHQMRGRVGRSARQAFCYFFVDSMSELSDDAKRRLAALQEFSELGDGYKIALKDLDIRGAGDLLGSEQSGFIADVGFETYCQLLEEAVKELKSGELKDIFVDKNEQETLAVEDCTIEVYVPCLIPDDYVGSASERLALYLRIKSLKNSKDIQDFTTELIDRFGPIPNSLETLLKITELKFFLLSVKISDFVLEKNAIKIKINAANFENCYNLNCLLIYVDRNKRFCSIKATAEYIEITFKVSIAINDIELYLTEFVKSINDNE